MMLDMIVGVEKYAELQKRMEGLGIREEDLEEKFVLGSGPGGQKVNKTASAVYLKHRATGIEVKCSTERSRETNRFLARRLLCEKIEKEIFGFKTAKEQETEKIRKQKKRKVRKNKKKLVGNSIHKL